MKDKKLELTELELAAILFIFYKGCKEQESDSPDNDKKIAAFATMSTKELCKLKDMSVVSYLLVLNSGGAKEMLKIKDEIIADTDLFNTLFDLGIYKRKK